MQGPKLLLKLMNPVESHRQLAHVSEGANEKVTDSPQVSVRRKLAWVSRNSRVRGMSSTDLAPAQTTATGVRPSSMRSADTSKVNSPPRCTPPMPAADASSKETTDIY